MCVCVCVFVWLEGSNTFRSAVTPTLKAIISIRVHN